MQYMEFGYAKLLYPGIDESILLANKYYKQEMEIIKSFNGQRRESKKLARYDCEVHHIDGDRFNNKPENLLPLYSFQHRAIHQLVKKSKTIVIGEKILSHKKTLIFEG